MILSAIGWLFSGAFATNAIPHLANGLSGNRFPTPFAKPHGKGLSSPLLNVLWAFFNIAVFGILLYFNGSSFSPLNAAIMAAGALAVGIRLALIFEKKDRD